MLSWFSSFFTQIENFFGTPKLLFDGWQSTVRITLTTIFLYLILIVLLKIFGSRSVSSFSVYDMIATITIGSVISSTLVLKEINLINGMVAIIVLLVLQFSLSKLVTKWEGLYPFANPTPKVVFYKGEFKNESMKKVRVNKEEIYSAIRREAGTTSDNVEAVLLEPNGDLTVIKNISPEYENEITKYM
ncbi:MAG: YetF domain-containing protein [Desemzia incerta]